MACPYFYPTEPLSLGYWGKRSRLPLGDLFAGCCRADPPAEFRPEEDVLRDCCNLGYARRHCGRFPPGDGPDAARFAVSGDQDGIVRIYYALERDHRPWAHGPLEYDRRRRALVAPPSSDALRRQAEAFVESYLRRK